MPSLPPYLLFNHSRVVVEAPINEVTTICTNMICRLARKLQIAKQGNVHVAIRYDEKAMLAATGLQRSDLGQTASKLGTPRRARGDTDQQDVAESRVS